MSFALPANIIIRPSPPDLLLFQPRPFFGVLTEIEPTQEVADPDLHAENHEDANLPWDVVRCVLRLKDLGADDVSDAEGHKGHGIESILSNRLR